MRATGGTGRVHQSNAVNPKGLTEGGLLGTPPLRSLFRLEAMANSLLWHVRKFYNSSNHIWPMEEESPNMTEALLIATVSPLSKNEISSALVVEQKEVERALRILKKRYENTALELKVIGRKYKIGVRDRYSEVAFKYSESELGKGELEIIGLLFNKGKTYISHVERLRGRKAMEELDHLSRIGLVEVTPIGRRRVVKLTRAFFSKYGKVLKERVREDNKVLS